MLKYNIKIFLNIVRKYIFRMVNYKIMQKSWQKIKKHQMKNVLIFFFLNFKHVFKKLVVKTKIH